MQRANGLAAQSIAVEFAGDFDPVDFVQLLAQLPIPSGAVRIRVEVERV